jgi:hypothetical protein
VKTWKWRRRKKSKVSGNFQYSINPTDSATETSLSISCIWSNRIMSQWFSGELPPLCPKGLVRSSAWAVAFLYYLPGLSLEQLICFIAVTCQVVLQVQVKSCVTARQTWNNVGRFNSWKWFDSGLLDRLFVTFLHHMGLLKVVKTLWWYLIMMIWANPSWLHFFMKLPNYRHSTIQNIIDPYF